MHASMPASCVSSVCCTVCYTLYPTPCGACHTWQVVGVVAEEGEEVPVHHQLQGRLSRGGAKGLPLSLGHLRTQSWTIRQDQYHHRWAYSIHEKCESMHELFIRLYIGAMESHWDSICIATAVITWLSAEWQVQLERSDGSTYISCNCNYYYCIHRTIFQTHIYFVST